MVDCICMGLVEVREFGEKGTFTKLKLQTVGPKTLQPSDQKQDALTNTLPGICLSDNVHTRGILESPAYSPIKLYTMIRENR